MSLVCWHSVGQALVRPSCMARINKRHKLLIWHVKLKIQDENNKKFFEFFKKSTWRACPLVISSNFLGHGFFSKISKKLFYLPWNLYIYICSWSSHHAESENAGGLSLLTIINLSAGQNNLACQMTQGYTVNLLTNLPSILLSRIKFNYISHAARSHLGPTDRPTECPQTRL